jgi:hypothetical protein
MHKLVDNPLIVGAAAFITLWLSAIIGSIFRERRPNHLESVSHDFRLIMAGTLTLLSLIIGFSFSMAIYRYQQRQTCEDAEANAIETEYIRGDFLAAADATRFRGLLTNYLDLRILFYTTRDEQRLHQINLGTAKLERELLEAIHACTGTLPPPFAILVASGMNDVLKSQGDTQAAWSNRIPFEAWGLMTLIAVCCNALAGFAAPRSHPEGLLMLVLPIVLSIAFYLIADVDNPRSGLILMQPQNLVRVARFLQGH